MGKNIVLTCPHCGGRVMQLTPKLEATLGLIAKSEEGITTRELAKLQRISVPNAGNRASELAKLGLVTREERKQESGGIEHVYRITNDNEVIRHEKKGRKRKSD